MTIIIIGLGMMHVIPNVKTTLCEAEVLNTQRMQPRMAQKPVSSVRTRKFGRLQKYFSGSPTIEHSPRSIGNLDMKNFKASLAVAAALALAAIAAPANADPLKNIVLVHGAWVDASGWKPIYEILTKDGFNVTMVQEPETSFADDVAASWGIVAASDKIINPDLERWYYARAKSRTIEIKGASHAVYESHPGEVAAAIANAPRNAQNARSVQK